MKSRELCELDEPNSDEGTPVGVCLQSSPMHAYSEAESLEGGVPLPAELCHRRETTTEEEYEDVGVIARSPLSSIGGTAVRADLRDLSDIEQNGPLFTACK